MADKLNGSAIDFYSIPANRLANNSITSTQIQPSLYTTILNATHPKIRSLTYPGDDTAANTGGGQTVIVNGTGFGPNVAIYINNSAVPSVTVTNANSVSFTTAAQAAATYPLYLINTDDGATAILIPGIQYSGTPAWVTTSPLADQTATAAWSISLSATGDSPIVYSLQAGSSLPAGITLAANGLISGTMTSPPATDTTYNFTVVAIDPQNQDASKAFSVSVTVTVDTQFNYNVLLLHADGTNNGNNHAFLDSSTNNFAITRNGNASQGSFSPFSPTGWSNYLDGSSYVRFAENTAFVFGTGDFTVEAWIYRSSSGVRSEIVSHYTNTDSGWVLYVNTSDKLGWGEYTSTPVIGTSSIPSNMWVHVAAARSGTTVRLFINGALEASGTVSRDYLTNTNGISIGTTKPTYTSDPILVGYISNVRLVKGTALYTAAFTVPTTALTAVSGTSLLTCQSNRFIDNSTNAFTAIIVGSPSVQAFSPFASTTAYSTSSHGGSAYFDGTGDYLAAADNVAWYFTGDYTVECWAYWASTSSSEANIIAQHRPADSSNQAIEIYSNSTTLYFTYGSSYTTTTITAGQWYHIAMSCSSGTVSCYLNGTRVNTFAMPTRIDSADPLTIGARTGSGGSGATGYFTGYITDARVVKGSAVYSGATITVPTAPLTAISNTQLLLSCTNGQIFDSTTKGVLECVGDTKVNTSVYKYGTGSIFFDGTGDYLVVNAGTTNLYAFGTGDFTVEGWFYPTTNSGSSVYRALFDTLGSGAAATTAVRVYYYNNTLMFTEYTTTRISGGTPVLNAWNHFALNRTASQTKLYLNGTQVGSTYADTNSYVCGASRPTIGGSGYSVGTEMFIGNMDDIRVTKGLGRYPYNFTPPTKAFADKGGADTSTSDTYFPYTTLLLPGNGTNNANNQAFVDSSTNNFAITRNGNATQGTFSPFSQTGWSAFFDGSGDYLSLSWNTAFDISSGNWTIEGWVYLIDGSVEHNIISQNNLNNGYTLRINSTGTLQFFIVGGISITSSTTVPANQWTHVAAVNVSGTVNIYINGVSVASGSQTGTVPTSGLTIGGDRSSTPGNILKGYLSNLRLVKGTAVYTAAFTPPTSALTAISNTSLLICQSNRFIDNSTNAFAITKTGDVSIQAFSPFSPSAVYAAANNGGSVYFDGTGDYLSVANNAVFDMGSSDFTIEGWFYQTASGTYPTICGKYEAGYQASWAIGMTSTNWDVYTYYGATSFLTIYSGARPTLNQWVHFALERNGANIEFYVNGTRLAQVGAQTLRSSSSAVAIGALGAGYITGYEFPGYISNLRIVKGAAVYSGATYTVPTAPLTAITNTSLLLSATNGGIIDATGKNVFETVGDTKISTTQSKFGGSSIFFDGTDDRLVTAASPGFAFGTGDFTIEAWIYSADVSNATQRGWIQTSDTAGGLKTTYTTGVLAFFGAPSNGVVGVNIGNTNYTSAAGTISVNTWTHIAFTRYNGTVTVWVNGINVASGTGNTTNLTGQYICVGGYYSTGYLYSGYIDDLRITKGIARYTQNFTPPTSALLTK